MWPVRRQRRRHHRRTDRTSTRAARRPDRKLPPVTSPLQRRPLLVATAALALTLPGLAAPASADTLACGDTITTSTRLTHDLVCGPGDGLVIGADGVVLDLADHTISGAGAYGAGAGAGVRIAGRSDVTVTRGTITGFATAVEVQQSWRAALTKLTASRGDRGINVGGGGNHHIAQNTLTDNGRDAVRLAVTTGNVVRQNVLAGNVFGIGVADFSTANLVERNSVAGSRDWGVAVFGSATGTTVRQNGVSASTADGILVTADTSGTVVDRNATVGNGDDGIDVRTTDATIAKNRASDNGDLGISAPDGVRDGGGNVAGGNGNPAQCNGVQCEVPEQ